MKINIWTDGGCRGNGKEDNSGGWGAVLKYKEHVKEIYGSSTGVTNNQMELTAVIKALEAIKTKNVPITVYSDSKYVVTGINEWVEGWVKNNWIKKDKKPVLNSSLWQRLLLLKDEQENIKFKWVRGHNDNEGNERADDLVNIAMDELELEQNEN